MNKLSKDQEKQRDALIESLRAQQSKLEDAVSQFNQTMTAAWVKVEAAIEEYNGIAADAEAFREDVASEQESYMEEKTERWQEGKRGQAYQEWRDAWSERLEPIEIDEPEELSAPELDHADKLEAMPSDPGAVC
jgi:peptidoglycan hydrolase CwlO-like protein